MYSEKFNYNVCGRYAQTWMNIIFLGIGSKTNFWKKKIKIKEQEIRWQCVSLLRSVHCQRNFVLGPAFNIHQHSHIWFEQRTYEEKKNWAVASWTASPQLFNTKIIVCSLDAAATDDDDIGAIVDKLETAQLTAGWTKVKLLFYFLLFFFFLAIRYII